MDELLIQPTVPNIMTVLTHPIQKFRNVHIPSCFLPYTCHVKTLNMYNVDIDIYQWLHVSTDNHSKGDNTFYVAH